MARGKKKKKRGMKIKDKKEEREVLKTRYPLIEYSLNRLSDFLKSDDEIVAVCFQVETSNLTKESIVIKYKSQIINILQDAARRRRKMINPDKIYIKALPLGEETYIKGWFKLEDVVGAKKDEITSIPRGEGLWVAQ